MDLKSNGGSVSLTVDRKEIGTCGSITVDRGIGQRQGKALLAHELTHVVQQNPGQPVTLQLDGVDRATAQSLVPSQVKIIMLSMTDTAGRKFGISGKVTKVEPSRAAANQWTLTLESVQRAV